MDETDKVAATVVRVVNVVEGKRLTATVSSHSRSRSSSSTATAVKRKRMLQLCGMR